MYTTKKVEVFFSNCDEIRKTSFFVQWCFAWTWVPILWRTAYITEVFKLEVQLLDNTKWLLKQNFQMVKIFHSESRVASPSPSVHSTGVFGFRDPTILQGSWWHSCCSCSWWPYSHQPSENRSLNIDLLTMKKETVL